MRAPTKTKITQEALRENPEANTREIIDLVKAKGFKVNAHMVHAQRSALRRAGELPKPNGKAAMRHSSHGQRKAPLPETLAMGSKSTEHDTVPRALYDAALTEIKRLKACIAILTS